MLTAVWPAEVRWLTYGAVCSDDPSLAALSPLVLILLLVAPLKDIERSAPQATESVTWMTVLSHVSRSLNKCHSGCRY